MRYSTNQGDGLDYFALQSSIGSIIIAGPLSMIALIDSTAYIGVKIPPSKVLLGFLDGLRS